MKKVLLAAVFLLFGAGQSFGAVILSWNTFGNLGTETSEASVSNIANISAASLTLGSGITAAANGNRFGGSGWFDAGNTAGGNTLGEAINGNSYIQFIVTPTGGATFSATSLDFTWDRSATGPSSVALRSSFDNFATDLGSVTNIIQSAFAPNSITIAGLNNVAAATTFRLYGFGASATGGTGGFDTNTDAPSVTFNGSVTAVPEPTSIALVSLMGCTGLVSGYRRRKAKSNVV